MHVDGLLEPRDRGTEAPNGPTSMGNEATVARASGVSSLAWARCRVSRLVRGCCEMQFVNMLIGISGMKEKREKKKEKIKIKRIKKILLSNQSKNIETTSVINT